MATYQSRRDHNVIKMKVEKFCFRANVFNCSPSTERHNCTKSNAAHTLKYFIPVSLLNVTQALCIDDLESRSALKMETNMKNKLKKNAAAAKSKLLMSNFRINYCN